MSEGLTDWLLDGGYGIDIAFAHVDFVANGDGLQPGCSTRKKRSRKLSSLSSRIFVQFMYSLIVTAKIMFSEFLSYCSQGGGGGVPGISTIWLMSQGLSTLWLKSTHAQGRGGVRGGQGGVIQIRISSLFLMYLFSLFST